MIDFKSLHWISLHHLLCSSAVHMDMERNSVQSQQTLNYTYSQLISIYFSATCNGGRNHSQSCFGYRFTSSVSRLKPWGKWNLLLTSYRRKKASWESNGFSWGRCVCMIFCLSGRPQTVCQLQREGGPWQYCSTSSCYWALELQPIEQIHHNGLNLRRYCLSKCWRS